MKSRKFNKKLVLKKQTIANMNHDEMNVIKGGNTIFPRTCWGTCTCVTNCDGTCTTYCNHSCPKLTICA